jgi:hypothetical protein
LFWKLAVLPFSGEAVPSFETMVNFLKATRRHISENNILYSYLRDNLNSSINIDYLKIIFFWDVRLVFGQMYTSFSGEVVASIFIIVSFGIGLCIMEIVVKWKL